MVVSPGRTEFIEKYFEVIGELQARGFVVLVHDWRGQGLSDRLLGERLRGHAIGVRAFLDDYALVLGHYERRLPEPWINLSHSMGGALTILAMAEGERRFAGALLSAPMIGLNTRGAPRIVARSVAWTAARSGAGRVYADPREWSGARLSRDTTRQQRWRDQLAACPDLRLGGFTWGWLQTAFEATARLASHPKVAEIAAPVTILGAGVEDLVDNAAQQALAARLPAGRFLQIPDAYHELLMETDDVRAEVWAAFDALVAPLTPPRA